MHSLTHIYDITSHIYVYVYIKFVLHKDLRARIDGETMTSATQKPPMAFWRRSYTTRACVT